MSCLVCWIIWKQKSCLRFCQEYSNLLLPKGWPAGRIMAYGCRICLVWRTRGQQMRLQERFADGYKVRITTHTCYSPRTHLSENKLVSRRIWAQMLPWYVIQHCTTRSRVPFPSRLIQIFHAHAVVMMSKLTQYRLSASVDFSAVQSFIKINQNERRRGWFYFLSAPSVITVSRTRHYQPTVARKWTMAKREKPRVPRMLC